MSHKKIGPDRFSPFDVYWIQTNKQTDKQTERQAKFIYRRIHVISMFLTLKIDLFKLWLFYQSDLWISATEAMKEIIRIKGFKA